MRALCARPRSPAAVAPVSLPAVLSLLMVLVMLAPLPARAQPAAGAVREDVALIDLLEELEATLRWDPYTETGSIDLSRGRVVFRVGSPWVLLDYRQLLGTGGVERSGGELRLPKETAEAIRSYFHREALQQPRVAVILIDPGHGGKDAGAIGTLPGKGETRTVQEKAVVLEVGRRLNELLSRKYPDKRILMTRADDTYIRLEERTEMANRIALGPNEAVIFISIHANASLNRKARGFEVWYLPAAFRRNLIDPQSLEEGSREIAPILNVLLEEEYSIESITLAREILAGFEREVGAVTENRGLKEESWFVVRNARMPSVLIELGFVTHADEGALLLDEDYLKKLVNGIYTGIGNFVGDFETTRGFTE